MTPSHFVIFEIFDPLQISNSSQSFASPTPSVYFQLPINQFSLSPSYEPHFSFSFSLLFKEQKSPNRKIQIFCASKMMRVAARRLSSLSSSSWRPTASSSTVFYKPPSSRDEEPRSSAMSDYFRLAPHFYSHHRGQGFLSIQVSKYLIVFIVVLLCCCFHLIIRVSLISEIVLLDFDLMFPLLRVRIFKGRIQEKLCFFGWFDLFSSIRGFFCVFLF